MFLNIFFFKVREREALSVLKQRFRKIVISQDYGIPAHYGLLSALGAGMMVVAVLSASYHVCPNRLNFQFGQLRVMFHFPVLG